MKFVRVIEPYGTRNTYRYIYDGVLISKTKEEISILGVGPEKQDYIQERHFSLDEVTVKEVQKEDVEHYFRLAILKGENELNDAEFNLLDAQRYLQNAKRYFKKYFGKEIK